MPIIIGRGGAATVAKGKWRNIDVAIKIMFEYSSSEEFKREIAAYTALKHPNVLQFLGACTQQTKQYLITPYLKLGSLDGIIHDKEFIFLWQTFIQNY